ncbi:MAG TPA: TonB-dependent receptor [Steroidobacteraceae bacterium]|nr:TonB-dependent receptor [Steroidobacteraceae bacterium]
MKKHLLMAGLALASTLSVSARAETADGAPATAGADVEEIVVTATRRQESIDKVPMSIAALSQERMDQQGVKSIEDLAKFTPGVNFAPAGDGLTNSIAIRGVSSGVGASTTGIYIDDTPIQVRSGTGIVTQNTYPHLFDLDRVEVLRGPQGTLFGTGSMGGTIRFITPEPDLHSYSVYSRAEYGSTRGGDPSYEIGAAAGGPVVDGVLGFRASALYSDQGGFINREPFTGNVVTEKGVNYNYNTVFRGALKFQPGDSVTITPAIYYQKQRTNDTYAWLTISNPGGGDYNTGYTQPEPIDDTFTLPSLNVRWRLPGMELISNTSFFYRHLTRASDYTNFLWNALSGGVTPTDPLPGYRTVSLDEVRQNSFTQEIRLQSTATDSQLQWLVGALFQSSRLYTNQYEYDPQLPALSLALFGAPIEDIFGEGLVDGPYSATIDQWAVDRQTALFGQIDYTFTPQLKGTLGVRVARTTLDFHRQFGGPLLCILCNGSPELTGGSTPANNPVTPRFGLAYQPDDRSLYYLSAAKGYRVGGVNNPSIATDRPGCPSGLQAPESYRPDHLWSYEIGAKNQLADGHLRTQVSVYYIDWRDIQEAVSSTGCLTSSYKDNLGRARIEGFDFAAEWRVIEKLSLSLTGGYTHARYASTSYGAPSTAGVRSVIAADGDSLGVAPWNAVLSGQYDFDVWQKRSYFRVDYTYTAKDTAETPQRDPVATSVYDPDVLADPAIRLLGARLGMHLGGLDLSVFGRNLLNSTPPLGYFHDSLGDPLYYVTTVRPRTVGVTATYRY